MACLFHKWDGCKCLKCGKIRDKNHSWYGGCKCSICGKVRDENHMWNSCKGVCVRCGKTREIEHDWDLCKGICRRNCGATCEIKHDYRDAHFGGYVCMRCEHSRIFEMDNKAALVEMASKNPYFNLRFQAYERLCEAFPQIHIEEEKQVSELLFQMFNCGKVSTDDIDRCMDIIAQMSRQKPWLELQIKYSENKEDKRQSGEHSWTEKFSKRTLFYKKFSVYWIKDKMLLDGSERFFPHERPKRINKT